MGVTISLFKRLSQTPSLMQKFMSILMGSTNCIENSLNNTAGMSSEIVASQVFNDIDSFYTVFTLIFGISSLSEIF